MKRLIKITSSILFLLVLISATADAGEQAPWQNNQNGALCYMRTSSQAYTMGYSFTPRKDGEIIRLGGFFEGEKVVKLWNKATGEELASAAVAGKFREWHYTDIPPVEVEADTTYIVAAHMGSSGITYQYRIEPFPQVYEDIVIESSTYTRGHAIPTHDNKYAMSGQVDIVFVSDDDNPNTGTDVAISRQTLKMSDDIIKVTLNIQASYFSGPNAYWIVEYIPEGSIVVNASHGGVIFDDRVEWIASEFTKLYVGEPRVSYEIISDGRDHDYKGALLCSNTEGEWHYNKITHDE
jgi:hypothetical protein